MASEVSQYTIVLVVLSVNRSIRRSSRICLPASSFFLPPLYIFLKYPHWSLALHYFRSSVHRSFASCCIDSLSIAFILINLVVFLFTIYLPLRNAFQNTMKYTVALLALAASVTAQTPPGCSENFAGTFEISPVNVTGSTKRSIIEAVSRSVDSISHRPADI